LLVLPIGAISGQRFLSCPFIPLELSPSYETWHPESSHISPFPCLPGCYTIDDQKELETIENNVQVKSASQADSDAEMFQKKKKICL
jgi:hypothetical protein